MTKKRNNTENVGVLEVKAFKCPYCPKLYRRKYFAEKHLARCGNNPDNDRLCFHCKFNEYIKQEMFYERGDEFSTIVDTSYCSKIKCCLYPPITEHKGNAYEFEVVENVPMRKECEHFQRRPSFTDFEETIEQYR